MHYVLRYLKSQYSIVDGMSGLNKYFAISYKAIKTIVRCELNKAGQGGTVYLHLKASLLEWRSKNK